MHIRWPVKNKGGYLFIPPPPEEARTKSSGRKVSIPVAAAYKGSGWVFSWDLSLRFRYQIEFRILGRNRKWPSSEYSFSLLMTIYFTVLTACQKPLGVLKSLNSDVQLIRHKTLQLPQPHAFSQSFCVLNVWLIGDTCRPVCLHPGWGWKQSEWFPPRLLVFGTLRVVMSKWITVPRGYCVYVWNRMKVLVVLFLSETFWNILAVDLSPGFFGLQTPHILF